MRRQYYLLTGLFLYLLLLGILMQFDWMKMIRPVPFFSVFLGILLLTLTQYRKGMNREEILACAQWNAFLAGLLTSLLSILSVFSSIGADSNAIHQLADKLVPLIYGSIMYLIIRLLNPEHVKKQSRIENSNINKPQADGVTIALSDPLTANSILFLKGFSPRECHVAFKLIEGISNKEIAEQLFISETTVKKHIQNMFRKCGANDRQEFIALYALWMKEGI